MTFTPPTSPASPGTATFGEVPFRPLTPIPGPFRLAGEMFLSDCLNFFAGLALVGGAGGLLLMSAAISSHSLPAAIAMLLVSCFGAGFTGYVITKARGFA